MPDGRDAVPAGRAAALVQRAVAPAPVLGVDPRVPAVRDDGGRGHVGARPRDRRGGAARLRRGRVGRRPWPPAAAAIVGVSLLRSLGVVGRRYFGMKALRGMQRTWFVRLTDTYLRVPLSYFGRHPAGEAAGPRGRRRRAGGDGADAAAVLAGRDRADRAVGREPGPDRPAAHAHRAGAVPRSRRHQPGVQPAGRGPGGDHAGPPRRRGHRGPRVVRGRAGGEVARVGGPRGRPPPPCRRRAAHRPAGRRPPAGHVRARARRPAEPRHGGAGGRRVVAHLDGGDDDGRAGAGGGAVRHPHASRCASWASCSRRCRAPSSRPTA